MNAPLRQPVENPYQTYADEKSKWIREHPNATPAEYEAAMAELVKRLGL